MLDDPVSGLGAGASDLARILARSVPPGEWDQVSAALKRGTELDDIAFAAFLERLAGLIERGGPIRAEDVDAIVPGC